MTIAHLGTDIQTRFGVIDEAGDTVEQPLPPLRLRVLSPFAVLELYEHLHAERNRLRRNHELPEVPQSDLALVLLAFLRRLENEPIGHLGQLTSLFAEVVREIQERRLEHVEEMR
jgi:hypothetical protein